MKYLSGALWVALLGIAACADAPQDSSLYGTIPFEPVRPASATIPDIDPYVGTDPEVLAAQQSLTTGEDLHAKVIYRTCTPNGGVCHHAKEYPALHTPANFLAAIDAPCNVQSGTPEAAYDRCERPGDRLKLFGGKEIEIGYINYIPGEYDPSPGDDEEEVPLDDATPGLHIYLAEPVSTDWNGDPSNRWGVGQFIRSFVNDGVVEEISFSQFNTQWFPIGDGAHLLARVRNYQSTTVQQLLAVGIVEGDRNRNGVFGARSGDPVALIEPGNPEESYLIARLRGLMLDETVPGSRMPLANQPLSISEMLALYCFVEGLGKVTDGNYNLAAPIDYKNCSYSADPENLNLLGSGVTWSSRISAIIEANCTGCHSATQAQGGLVLAGEKSEVYKRLMEPSSQVPELNLIEPGDPLNSYLWLKLLGDEGTIVGSGMPLNPLTGEGKLADALLEDIENWIDAGAVENE